MSPQLTTPCTTKLRSWRAQDASCTCVHMHLCCAVLAARLGPHVPWDRMDWGAAKSQATALHSVQVHLLRRMLEWQNDLLQEPLTKAAQSLPAGAEAVEDSTQVQILIVPTFKIEQVQRGTTAGDIIRSKVYFCSLSALGCSSRSPFVTS